MAELLLGMVYVVVYVHVCSLYVVVVCYKSRLALFCIISIILVFSINTNSDINIIILIFILAENK